MKTFFKKIPSSGWAFLAFVLILLYNLFFTANFFSITMTDGHLYGSIIDIFFRASPIMLMSVGMTLVIATKGIDISVGSIAAISGAIAAVLLAKTTAPLWLVIILPLAISLLLGSWNGFLVSVIKIQPIIATLILMVTGRGIAQLISDGQVVVFRNPGLEFFSSGYIFGLPFNVYLFLAFFLCIQLLTRKTGLGLFIESIGINAKASRLTGIPVRLVTFFVYVISGLGAGIAGLFYVSTIRAADSNNAALNTELDAILAVVIGGTSMDGGKFSLLGSMFGALVMQSLTITMIMSNIPVEASLVVKAAVVFILVVLLSPTFRSWFASLRTQRKK